MKFRKLFAIVMSLLIVATVAVNSYDGHLKKPVGKELSFEKVSEQSVQSKEAYKLDDAEYTVCLVSKSNLATAGFGFEGVALLGGIALVVSLFRRAKGLKQIIGLSVIVAITLVIGLVALINPPLASLIALKVGTGKLVLGATGAATIKIKKDGLKDSDRTFVEDLEKRFELVDVQDKAQVDLAIRTAIADHFKDIDLNQIKEMLGVDDAKSIRGILKLHGQKLEELKSFNKENEVPSIRKQVETWMETNKDAIQAIKEKRGRDLPALHIRAAITMTEGSSLNSSAYLPRVGVQPGIVNLIRVAPTFWDRLQKGATKLNPYVWVNKHNKQGSAQFTAEGNLKPLASFELQTENSVPKKVAERMKASTQLLSDVDGLTAEIQNELAYEVSIAANNGVLTGDGTGENPHGITLIASAYTLASITGIIAPNNSDAIRSAIAQLRSLNFNGPLTAYMNPVDLATMDMEKSLQGQYVLPPFTTVDGRNIAATPIVEDNNIAQGHFLIGDMSKYRVLMFEDFFIQWGWENDDFSKNLVTVIGEMRFHQFVSANHVGAFIYDAFANVKTAIS